MGTHLPDVQFDRSRGAEAAPCRPTTERRVEMQKDLRILHLEDVPMDAELVERQLRDAGLHFILQHAATQDAFTQALEEFRPDVVLAGYSLPDFDGLSAIRLVRQKDPIFRSSWSPGSWETKRR